jgi:hypothetical protein
MIGKYINEQGSARVKSGSRVGCRKKSQQSYNQKATIEKHEEALTRILKLGLALAPRLHSIHNLSTLVD